MGKQSEAEEAEKVSGEPEIAPNGIPTIAPTPPAPTIAPTPSALTKVEPPKKSWTIEDSEELYRIQGWGEPYFSINAAGHVTVSPQGDRGGSLDLFELVNALKQRNLGLPLLIRFSDILEDRIERLNACFSRAIACYTYPKYR